MIKSKLILPLLILFGVTSSLFAQNSADREKVNNFRTTVSVTNNGISLLPSFSLGKPAVLFEASVGRRLSFDPQFRFAINGKPWSFVFWWRYKVVNEGKFRLTVGAHPAVLFGSAIEIIDGIATETITARRFVATEVFPSYVITDNISVGMYYLYSHRVEKYGLKSTHFVTARATFSSLNLGHQFYLGLTPQLYYLIMDDNDGTYITSTFSLTKAGCPLSISALVNQPIKTNIVGGESFNWNVSLNYTFNSQYIDR